jgi:hypothetical protein
MINSRCVHILTGHIGVIISEIDGKFYLDQWVVKWDKNIHNEKQTLIYGKPYFYNTKDEIHIIP